MMALVGQGEFAEHGVLVGAVVSRREERIVALLPLEMLELVVDLYSPRLHGHVLAPQLAHLLFVQVRRGLKEAARWWRWYSSVGMMMVMVRRMPRMSVGAVMAMVMAVMMKMVGQAAFGHGDTKSLSFLLQRIFSGGGIVIWRMNGGLMVRRSGRNCRRRRRLRRDVSTTREERKVRSL
jgi:hypothetical protein